MTTTDLKADVAIIGAGLSGLALTEQLIAAGRDVQVFEARDRIGGRILGMGAVAGPPVYDMGPAWIWPHNRRMLALVERLGLEVFPQFSTGNLVYQDASGAVRRDLTFSPMDGSLRVAGGLAMIVGALATRIGLDRLHRGHRAIEVMDSTDSARATFETSTGIRTVQATHVVLAVPPRVIAEQIGFQPTLPDQITHALNATPTWMAGHAKLIAVYDTPFWRDAGLSGDGKSQRGPLAEIHDASPADGREGALFGFVGTPPDGRQDPTAVKAAAISQLTDMFGDLAARPKAVLWQDWVRERETAVEVDLAPLTSHPHYHTPRALDALEGSPLHIAVSEFAPEDGGFLEGALAAADAACAKLSD